jgi:hypothetical protein
LILPHDDVIFLHNFKIDEWKTEKAYYRANNKGLTLNFVLKRRPAFLTSTVMVRFLVDQHGFSGCFGD